MATVAEDLEQRGLSKMAKVRKVIKTIKIDVDKCNGCRACEVICSAFHANPKYSSNNPARSRIRWCATRLEMYICRFTPGNIPRRNAPAGTNMCWTARIYRVRFLPGFLSFPGLFKEPDSGLPIKCDMCEDNEPGKSRCACSGA